MKLLEVPDNNLLNNPKAISAIEYLSSIRKCDNSVTFMRKALDIRGLRGLGKHLWKDVEAQEYVKALREEWDK